MARCSPVQWTAVSRKQFGIGHMYIYTFFFCLEWPILWPPRILTFPPGTPCVCVCINELHMLLSDLQSNPFLNLWHKATSHECSPFAEMVWRSNLYKKKTTWCAIFHSLLTLWTDHSTIFVCPNKRSYCRHAGLFSYVKAWKSWSDSQTMKRPLFHETGHFVTMATTTLSTSQNDGKCFNKRIQFKYRHTKVIIWKVKLSLSLTNWALRHECVWGSRWKLPLERNELVRSSGLAFGRCTVRISAGTQTILNAGTNSMEPFLSSSQFCSH
jgi:hypothetical protein